MRRIYKQLLVKLLIALPLFFATVLNCLIRTKYDRRIYPNAAAAPQETESRIAIVFGAGLWRSGQPSPILYERIATAAQLYHAGKVRKLLLTGDNRFINYNEPMVMRRAALEMGVAEDDLILDYAGRRTYDGCYRAREIFGVQRAILVTQSFHLDRAMYICSALGVDSIGVAADRQAYSNGSQKWWAVRDFFALVAAWLDINVLHPIPVLGDKIEID
jgi:vancomycin permeability regulator SanA